MANAKEKREAKKLAKQQEKERLEQQEEKVTEETEVLAQNSTDVTNASVENPNASDAFEEFDKNVAQANADRVAGVDENVDTLSEEDAELAAVEDLVNTANNAIDKLRSKAVTESVDKDGFLKCVVVAGSVGCSKTNNLVSVMAKGKLLSVNERIVFLEPSFYQSISSKVELYNIAKISATLDNAKMSLAGKEPEVV